MTETASFLFELGTEELPPKALRRLETALAESVRGSLSDAELSCSALRSYATPRRLALRIDGLSVSQPVQKIEKRGPPTDIAYDSDGQPTRAAIAFAEGCGCEVTDLQRVETAKGAWLLYRAERPGRPAAELMPDIIAHALAALPIPKRMRWGDGDAEFVRPVHWVVMLMNDTVLDCEMLDIPAGRTTRGHRFHAPQAIELPNAAAYPDLLFERGRVIADFVARRTTIEDLVRAAATDAGGEAVYDEALIDEVTGLVEWPVTVQGQFEENFLRLPEEVLISTLQDHQRYFPVRRADGALLADFITISNLDSLDPAQVRAGNERVVRPRLADAAFFWDKDCETSLQARQEGLKQVVFQHGLGSLFDKSERVATLAEGLGTLLGAKPAEVRRAALLGKTDLLTEMVGEFPELQGRMGYYYALEDDESEAVATAIEEQYLPRHAGDRLPATAAGAALAVADRIDTIAGITSLGKKPSGNKDPFALRRAALGVLRILIEQGVEIDLVQLLRDAIALQPGKKEKPDELLEWLSEFFMDRLRRYYLEGHAPGITAADVTPEMFESVRARRPVSPLDFHQRLVAVSTFMRLEAANSLAAANKRIANILRQSDADQNTDIDATLFDCDEERQLHTLVSQLESVHQEKIAARDYEQVLQQLATLREPVDAYFDGVMVMADDRARQHNRIAQLVRLRRLFMDVADLSCIPTG